jgi:lipid-A-disaccharide synthase
MEASDVVILSSGTATLESALFRKPTVICYKISNSTFFIAKFLVRKKLIGMPNIILDKKIFPELLQKECNSQNIVRETLHFLNLNHEEKSSYQTYYDTIRESMGKPPILEKIAKTVIDQINL